MPESREGVIPPELVGTIIALSDSTHQASEALPNTFRVFQRLPENEKPVILQALTTKLQPIARDRQAIDVNFKRRFGTKLYRSTNDDSRAVLDMAIPCQNETDFVHKVQALSGMIDRIQPKVKDLIADQAIRRRIRGSINILKNVLREKFGSFDPEIISNLRKINRLRNASYPTHVLDERFAEELRSMGFSYPPDDWSAVWEAVLELWSRSFKKLTELLR